MRVIKEPPASHPRMGMRMWKAPNVAARRIICPLLILPNPKPVTAETLRTSIESPIERRRREKRSIPSNRLT
jgi:hypothetical protein